ncbi:hypothetical protein B5S28_g925 [[Candida] boidinii]|nr:hypothetical protein B5S28_g925 [[Candida] boidinii]
MSLAENTETERAKFEKHEGIVFVIQLSPRMFIKHENLGNKSKLMVILESLLEMISDLAITLPNSGIGCYFLNCDNKSIQKRINGDASDTNGKDHLESGTQPPSSSSYYDGIRADDNADFTENLIGSTNGIFRLFKLQDINANILKIVSDLISENISKDDTETETKGEELLNSLSERFPILNQDPKINYGYQLSTILNIIQDDFNLVPRFTKIYTIKKIFLFTDCDKPYNKNTQIRITLRKILEDLDESKVKLIPFLISNKNKKSVFDLSEYKNILTIDDTADNQTKSNPTSSSSTSPLIYDISISKIKEKISMIKEIKREAFRCPIELNDKIKFQIRGYALYSDTKPKYATNYYNENEKFRTVQKITHRLNANTGAEIIDSGINDIEDDEENKSNNKSNNTDKIIKLYSFDNGRQNIQITSDQLLNFFNFNETEKPILKILGFRNFTKYYNSNYSIDNPLFVFPDDFKDSPYTHSRRVFASLYQSMIKNNKFAIVWGMPRLRSYPSLYSLVPTLPQFNKSKSINGNLEGFYLIPLPFKDFIRLNPINTINEAPQDEIKDNLFEKLLPLLKNHSKTVTTKDGEDENEEHDVDDNENSGDKESVYLTKIPNPSLNWHFKLLKDEIIQAEVDLKEEDISKENIEFKRQVEINNFDETKKLVMNLRSNIAKNEEILGLFKEINSQLNKISNSENTSKVSKDNKKIKLQDPVLTDKDILIAWKTQSLKNYKADELKKYVKTKKGLIEDAKTKAAIIVNIEEYCESRFSK